MEEEGNDAIKNFTKSFDLLRETFHLSFTSYESSAITTMQYDKHFFVQGGIQQLRGQNFAIFRPRPLAWTVLIP